MPDNPMCETCRFWKENPYYQEGENSPGWCRRYAPRPRVLMYDDDSTDTSMTEIMWPVVSDGDWCGEHAPRVEEPRGGRPIVDSEARFYDLTSFVARATELGVTLTGDPLPGDGFVHGSTAYVYAPKEPPDASV